MYFINISRKVVIMVGLYKEHAGALERFWYAYLMDYFSMQITPLAILKRHGITTFTLRGQVFLAAFNKFIEESQEESMEILDLRANGTFGLVQQMSLNSYFLSEQRLVAAMPYFK